MNQGVLTHDDVLAQALRDHRLSWKAKGLLAFLVAGGDGAAFDGRTLAGMSRDGAHSTYGALRELREAGYVEPVLSRLANGRIQDLVYRIGSGTVEKDSPANEEGPAYRLPGASPDRGNRDQAHHNNNTFVVVVEQQQEGGTLPPAAHGRGCLPAASPAAPEEDVVARLVGEGVTREVALALLRRFGEEAVARQLRHLDLIRRDGRAPDNPGGWLRRAVEEDWTIPARLLAVEQEARLSRSSEEPVRAPQEVEGEHAGAAVRGGGEETPSSPSKATPEAVRGLVQTGMDRHTARSLVRRHGPVQALRALHYLQLLERFGRAPRNPGGWLRMAVAGGWQAPPQLLERAEAERRREEVVRADEERRKRDERVAALRRIEAQEALAWLSAQEESLREEVERTARDAVLQRLGDGFAGVIPRALVEAETVAIIKRLRGSGDARSSVA